MNRIAVIILILLFALFDVEAQSSLVQDYASSGNDVVTNFKPSLAVVVGILCIMFMLTFTLLLYAKFCHRGASVHGDQQNHPGILNGSRSRFSGIDKKVIESLPFFRFSSLKGAKQGLECSVCLSKFEEIEILRLLPKCKHAFHIDCIDKWLEKHSSCPLCRHKVGAEDPAIFAYSNSMRFLNLQSELREDSNIELYVQREGERNGSSRFSFRKSEKSNKEEEVLIQEEASDRADDDREEVLMHKFNHKIIVSDVFKNRWSNVSSSDLMFLNSEMLNAMSRDRFSSLEANKGLQLLTRSSRTTENEGIVKIKVEMERKRLFESKVNYSIDKTSPVCLPSTSDYTANSRIIDPAERRSVSEITALPRSLNFNAKNKTSESSSSETNIKEERIRRLWLRISRRTVQWFANREKRSQQSQNTTQHLDV